MGSYAEVLQIAEDRVLKKPKVYPENDPDLANSNFMNREEIRNEKAVYERLGSHEGIIHCFKALDDSIELAFANQIDAFSYVHARRVVHQGIALRNILLHNNSPKLCDSGESSILLLGTNMEQFCDYDTTPQVEILYLGYVLYSIVIWKEFKYDYFKNMRFPEAEELPATDGIPFGAVVRKCWAGEYASMEVLRRDVYDTAELQKAGGTTSTWLGVLLLALLGSFPNVIVHWFAVYD